MKRFWVLAMLAPLGCTSTSICGDGEELSSDGTTACLYRAALIEEGFLCPSEASTRTDLDDGAVVCSSEEPLPPEVTQQLEAQGYEGPANGSAWTVDETPSGPDEPADPPRDRSNDPRLFGTLIDIDNGQPLDAARLCLLDAEPEDCTTTDARGQFALQVAPNTEYAVTAEREGYHPRILPMPGMTLDSPLGLNGVRLSGWGLRTVEAEAALAATARLVQSDALGQVAVDVFADAIVTLEPRREDGGYSEYHDSSSTRVRFFNLEAGQYVVSVSASALSCEATGWPSSADNVIRVPVRAGFITNPLGVQCR